MNRYPWWKNLVVVAIPLIALFFALPNIFGKNPALEITAPEGMAAGELTTEIEAALSEAGISKYRLQNDGRQWKLLVNDNDQQLLARDRIRDRLGRDAKVTLDLVPDSPLWLQELAQPMFLGLDLRGGIHFLMEVDDEVLIDRFFEQIRLAVRTVLLENDIPYSRFERQEGKFVIEMPVEDGGEALEADQLISGFEQAANIDIAERVEEGNRIVELIPNPEAYRAIINTATQQSISILRRRIDELGVSEPLVQRQGAKRIVIELPGIQDPTYAKEVLGATASVEYRLVIGTPNDWDKAEQTQVTPRGSRIYHLKDGGGPILLHHRTIVTGAHIVDASSGFTDTGRPAVYVNLSSHGAFLMHDTTKKNVGRQMGVVFIETFYKDVEGGVEGEKERIETKEVISYANILEPLRDRFQTTGLTTEEAGSLALLLRAGSLPAPLRIVEERTVGPTLGADNIFRGFISVILGFALVLLFMMFYYRAFGMVANLALLVNLVIIVAVMSMLQATLTLPGIAGIVLTVGMAVDANVLIFERIREEWRTGNSPQASISLGYNRAFATIADANITTLIAAIMLFAFGTGPIKGFAITLCIGILTSMFTAIMGTRAIVNWLYGRQRYLKKLAI